MKEKNKKRALVLSGGGARGAFQIGVYQYLQERNWKPDMICGSSVGAINAVAIGCNLDLDHLINLWQNLERQKVYRISWLKQLKALFSKGYVPIVDSRPLKGFIENQIDFQVLSQCEREIIISAVHIPTSKIRYFSNKEIQVEHIMASSAIPVFFPWQMIHGQPYWDGGVMANTPILPALLAEMDEIIVVLLSPIGEYEMPLPESRAKAMERMFEQSMLASYQNVLLQAMISQKVKEQNIKNLADFNSFALSKLGDRDVKIGKTLIKTIAPDQMLGFQSILNFSAKQSERLILMGYRCAANRLDIPAFSKKL